MPQWWRAYRGERTDTGEHVRPFKVDKLAGHPHEATFSTNTAAECPDLLAAPLWIRLAVITYRCFKGFAIRAKMENPVIVQQLYSERRS